MPPTSHLTSFDTLLQLLYAIFEAHKLSLDEARELLFLTEYIQAQLYARHGDQLRDPEHRTS